MAIVNKRLPSDSFAGQLNEARAASTAGGGTAVTTTAKFIALLDGTKHAVVVARNFAGGAAVMQFALNPYLALLRTDNGLKTNTDYSIKGQYNPADSVGMNLNNLDTLVNGGSLYIGAHVPFRGVACTNVSVNTVASVLTVNYWNGTIWTAVSGFTDGTTTGGKTQAQTGNVIWTVPTDWTAIRLPETLPASYIAGWPVLPGAPTIPNIAVPPAQEAAMIPYSDRPRYWTQWSVSAKLSATVSNAPMLAMNRSTAYAELESESQVSFRTFKLIDGIANVEVLMNAGTGNCIVNNYTDSPTGIFL